ncbi:NAD(P)-binding protein [Atractiella rhizophila]|nr:NAD(P)-binding protein [Atractiella rhizophila]
MSAKVHIISADVSVASSIEEAVSEVSQKTDKVDVLINNAAVLLEGGGPTPFLDIPIGLITESFRVNVLGPIQMVRAFLPLLRKGTEKKVVNINSIAGSIGTVDPGRDMFWKDIGASGAYSISKAALNMATRKFDANLRHQGFTFIALHPGWVKTETAKVEKDGEIVQSQYTTEQSIRDQLELINKVTPQTANRFYAVDTEDKTLPW